MSSDMTLPPNVVESRQLDHTDGWAIPSCYLVYSLLKVRNESYVTSIHAPHTGSDTPKSPHTGRLTDFNPRSPYGERRQTTWT